MRAYLFCLLLVTGFCSAFGFPLWADAPKIAGASVDPNNRRHIIVDFDNPVPAAAAVDQKEYWIVYQRTGTPAKSTSAKRLDVERVDAAGLVPPLHEKHVDLYLREEIVGKPSIKEVQIWLANSTDLVRIDPLTKPSQLGTGFNDSAGMLTGAKSKSDADVYFNGSYTAVKDGDPVYDIDAFAGYMRALQKDDHFYGRLGLYGQVRTKTSPVVDPNSFLTYFVYQNVFGNGGKQIPPPDPRAGVPSARSGWWRGFQSPILNYRVFGAEFDRTAKEVNLINSPVITVPFLPIAPPKDLSSKVALWPQFNFLFGTEFVYVRKSVLAPTGQWHTRGLLGATFATGYAAKTKLFDSVQLTSSWQVRLPSAPEIFYDSKFAPIDPSTGKPNLKKTPPMLGTQPRHSFDTKFTYNYAAWGGVTFEYSYGSLPPAFNKTNHSFAFGLTFTLQQASFGRYSILRQ
ncbi:MAG: hypothetical protein ABSH28_07910 [Acidobacteriota bacterium]|jgi:hypothetical protein